MPIQFKNSEIIKQKKKKKGSRYWVIFSWRFEERASE